jgi:hypothetical protein
MSIMEFRNGKVVRETQNFADPFEAPPWRKQWVTQLALGDAIVATTRPTKLKTTGRSR